MQCIFRVVLIRMESDEIDLMIVARESNPSFRSLTLFRKKKKLCIK